MQSFNITATGSKIFFEIILDILYLPVWWYTKGLLQILIFLNKFLSNHQKALGLSVWVKNIFRPMYGQNDFAGALISFIIRVFQILVRSIGMAFWLLVALIILLFWVLLPIAVYYEISFQLSLI